MFKRLLICEGNNPSDAVTVAAADPGSLGHQAGRLCADSCDCKTGTETDVYGAALPGLLKRVGVGSEYKMHLLSRIVVFQQN